MPREQADAIASAAGDFLISPEIATKADLAALKIELESQLAQLANQLTIRLGGIAVIAALVRLPGLLP